MKYQTTRKAIVNSSANIVSVPYADLQHLLTFQYPTAYTAGVYGWNFDVYNVYGLTICTGYRGMPGRRANNIREFDEKARAIRNDWNKPLSKQQEEIENLLREFCEQA